MKKLIKSTKQNQLHAQSREGFTIVEVMLVIGITGLMLMGLIGGSFTAINRQRYNDTLRDFAEYMSRTYSEVIRPSSFGNNKDSTSLGNSMDYAILGKVLVFGADYSGYNNDDKRSVYSATLVGSTEILRSSDKTFLEELAADDKLGLICGATEFGEVTQISSVEQYLPLWDAYLQPIQATNNQEKFTGTMLIARTPTSATVHTAFAKDLTYDLKNNCTPENQSASGSIKSGLSQYTTNEDTTICVKNDNMLSTRAVQIDANGNNSSAVKTLTEDNLCR